MKIALIGFGLEAKVLMIILKVLIKIILLKFMTKTQKVKLSYQMVLNSLVIFMIFQKFKQI